MSDNKLYISEEDKQQHHNEHSTSSHTDFQREWQKKNQAEAAAADAEEDRQSKAKFYEQNVLFKPPFILALFTMMNFWTYFDRGTMAAVLVEVRSDDTIAGHGTTMSEAKAGALVSVFMAGFFATNPVFVAAGGYFTAKQIIIFGLMAWTVACIGAGLSQDYWMLLICRALVGVGEAAYAGFTVTIIDNMAPKIRRTMWIGTFYSMLPVGTAMGMAISGFIAADVSVGPLVGWRVAFILEVIPMLVVIAFTFFLPAMYNPVKAHEKKKTSTVVGEDGSTPEQRSLIEGEHHHEQEDDPAETAGAQTPKGELDEHVPLLQAAKRIFTNLDFLLLAFGYGMYAFVLGAVSAFAISMLVQGPMRMSAVVASVIVGGNTAFTGLGASVVGGLVVDKLGGSQGYNGVFKCACFNTAMIALSVPCGLIAMAAETLWLFLIVFTVGVFALFAVTAPVSASLLTVVPKNLRTYSISFSIFIMHLIGDFPSPIIAGALSDDFSQGCGHFKSNVTCQHGIYNASNTSQLLERPSENCVWMAKTQHSHGYCANTYQLRDALMIVFAVLSLAVPAWGTVALRMKRNVAQGIKNVTDMERVAQGLEPLGEEPEERIPPLGEQTHVHSGLSMSERDGIMASRAGGALN